MTCTSEGYYWKKTYYHLVLVSLFMIMNFRFIGWCLDITFLIERYGTCWDLLDYSLLFLYLHPTPHCGVNTYQAIAVTPLHSAVSRTTLFALQQCLLEYHSLLFFPLPCTSFSAPCFFFTSLPSYGRTSMMNYVLMCQDKVLCWHHWVSALHMSFLGKLLHVYPHLQYLRNMKPFAYLTSPGGCSLGI